MEKRRPTGVVTQELGEFRNRLYGSFTAWSDALFELADALLCTPGSGLLGHFSQP